jgi:hypothetical protein
VYQTTNEVWALRSKVAKQRNEIARLEQVVARLSVEKAELLLDLKMHKAELEKADGKVG